MCFSAHMTRRYEHKFEKYEKDVADDLRENLVVMFKYALSKGVFKDSTATRQMNPRLASIRPRDLKEKDQFVRGFINHYDSTRCDMGETEGLLASGCQVDADLIDAIREHINVVHNILKQGEKWRNIIPYTPLPRKSLLKLRDLIKYNRAYYLLGDIQSIHEIEAWLTIPPPPKDYFTAEMEEYVKTNIVVSKPIIDVSAEEAAKQKEEAIIKAQKDKADREMA
jgi:hypothetical protein